jgi:hypothetical protein
MQELRRSGPELIAALTKVIMVAAHMHPRKRRAKGIIRNA